MKTFLMHCKNYWKDVSMPVLLAALLMCGYLMASGPAHSTEGPTPKLAPSGKAVIDFRTGDPKLALIYLNLIGDTFKDREVQGSPTHPDFVVVFGGQSVKLLAKEPRSYSAEDKQTIEKVKHKISALASEGIKFDYCLYGGKLMDVEPDNVPGMDTVGNGWVSLISYQAKGYSDIPAY